MTKGSIHHAESLRPVSSAGTGSMTKQKIPKDYSGMSVETEWRRQTASGKKVAQALLPEMTNIPLA